MWLKVISKYVFSTIDAVNTIASKSFPYEFINRIPWRNHILISGCRQQEITKKSKVEFTRMSCFSPQVSVSQNSSSSVLLQHSSVPFSSLLSVQVDIGLAGIVNVSPSIFEYKGPDYLCLWDRAILRHLATAHLRNILDFSFSRNFVLVVTFLAQFASRPRVPLKLVPARELLMILVICSSNSSQSEVSRRVISQPK